MVQCCQFMLVAGGRVTGPDLTKTAFTVGGARLFGPLAGVHMAPSPLGRGQSTTLAVDLLQEEPRGSLVAPWLPE